MKFHQFAASTNIRPKNLAQRIPELYQEQLQQADFYGKQIVQRTWDKLNEKFGLLESDEAIMCDEEKHEEFQTGFQPYKGMQIQITKKKKIKIIDYLYGSAIQLREQNPYDNIILTTFKTYANRKKEPDLELLANVFIEQANLFLKEYANLKPKTFDLMQIHKYVKQKARTIKRKLADKNDSKSDQKIRDILLTAPQLTTKYVVIYDHNQTSQLYKLFSKATGYKLQEAVERRFLGKGILPIQETVKKVIEKNNVPYLTVSITVRSQNK